MNRLEKSIRSRMEKAIRQYDMIRDGDRILICVSGGADSLALLKLMQSRFSHVPREDVAFLIATIDLGFESEDANSFDALESHFQTTGLPYRILRTNIAKIALDENARKNPCFICSLYRRRRIYELAYEWRADKIAYGHHKDDIVETLLINILFGRKIEAMHPVQEIFQGKMHIIRPFAFVEEESLKQFARQENLPVVPKSCPVDGETRRQKIKQLIKTLQSGEKNANIRENIFLSLNHVHIDSLS